MARSYDPDDEAQISRSVSDLDPSQDSGSTPVLAFSARDYYDGQYRQTEVSEEASLGFSGISEIEEEEEEEDEGSIQEATHKDSDNDDRVKSSMIGGPLATIREERTGSSSLHSLDFNNNGDVVYVAVSKSEETSMEALRWTMDNAVEQNSTLVFLIHIFPEMKLIPSPLGMMPIEQVNATQRERFLAQERGKRRDYLQKFINVCSNSKVKVDTILIESSMEAKAILDLIPILNIRTLVVGTSKRSIKSKKVSGTAAQILKGAPEYCDVKIVCEGKAMVDVTATDTITPRASNASPSQSPRSVPQGQPLQQVGANNSSIWSCFKPKVVNT